MPSPIDEGRPTFGYRPDDPDADPIVTIVTPYFNTGEIFRETAESVMRQTLQQWEWVIVNDGSSDVAALETLESCRDLDRRIRVVDHAANRGAGAARNTGFREARTEYVVQLDSDDLLEPTMLEKLYWFLESHPDHAFVKGHTVGFGAESYVWANGFHFGEAFLDGNRAGITAMVRRSVHQEVGGYDESNRDGLEDWDFWLNCADHGYWGGTVHEPMSWYRRRRAHGDQWANWDGGDREASFHDSLKRRYPGLWRGGFPKLYQPRDIEYEPIPDALPVHNVLRKDRPHLLMIVPWLTVGGADKVNLDIVDHLIGRGWAVTIATTLDGDHSWEYEFARSTPDIFALHRFLRPVDIPRFLRYLIGSRHPDIVLVSNSELGYQLLPYLRAHAPEATFMDLCHAEQDDWKSGGHPNFSNLYRDQIDLTLVVSEHLREWMIDRGGDGSRIAVCHLGVAADTWRPDSSERRRVRNALGIAEQTTVILFAGRLAKEKQPKILAEVIFNLSRAGLDVLALVAGEGPDRAWLDGYRTEHLLEDSLNVLGPVSTDQVLELFRASDVFFLPSEREGIALSIFEAMSCGLPVVAADVGGQSELVTPEAGVLIERGVADEEVAAYTRALEALVDDPDRRAALGVAGRERIVRSFSLAAMGDCLEAAIDRGRDLHAKQPRDTVPPATARALASLAIDYQRLSRLLERGQMGPDVADSASQRAMGDPGKGAAAAGLGWLRRRSLGQRMYAVLMALLGGPYRRLKRRSPDRVAAWRNRARSILGYRR